MLLKNKMFWVYVSFAIVLVFGGLYAMFGNEWLMYPVFMAFGYCFVLSIVMIVYAFIINPLKKFLK